MSRNRLGAAFGKRRMQRKMKRIKLLRQIYRRLMERVLEREGWTSQRCGRMENLQVHHKTKRSQQGNDSLENLVTIFAYCHLAEHGQFFHTVLVVRICAS
jgi:5-methylcytosine-specific restriction endonuclease McrA